VSRSTFWGYLRRCREAPASSGCDSPGDKAKAGTRVRGAKGVRTLRPVSTMSLRGLASRRHGVPPCHRARAQVAA